MENLIVPKNWRKGQTIFNFLEWIQQNYPCNNGQSVRMADPFHFSDAELSLLYQKFLNQHGNQ